MTSAVRFMPPTSTASPPAVHVARKGTTHRPVAVQCLMSGLGASVALFAAFEDAAA
jgi:hypothetical protein